MLSVELLGFVGGALITFGLVPQVVRVWRLKSAQEISLLFTVLFIIGAVCWLVYGIVLRLSPVILWNSICLCLMFALLYAKIKFGR